MPAFIDDLERCRHKRKKLVSQLKKARREKVNKKEIENMEKDLLTLRDRIKSMKQDAK